MTPAGAKRRPTGRWGLALGAHRREIIGLGLAGAVLGGGLVAPPPAGIDPAVQGVLAVFLATVLLWIFRPVPYAISSLACVLLLFGLGLAESFSMAVAGFSSTLVFFFILLLLVGHSIAAVDLDAYVATRLVSTTSSPRSSVRRLIGALLLLAFVMPSGLARTVTFMPVIDQITETYALPDDSPFRRLGYYLIGHVNHLGSLALMTGGGMPIVTAAFVDTLIRPITWIEWAIYMAPPTVLVYLATMGAASRFYSVSEEPMADRPGPGLAPDTPTDDAPEPMTQEQRLVVYALGLAIALWIVGSFVGIPPIIPAMVIVFVLALPGVGIITADAVSEISWGVIFLMGAMLSLLEVMQAVDAIDFLIEGLLALLPATEHPLVILAFLIGIAVLVRSAFSGVSPALLILLPILIEFAPTVGIDPLYLAFTIPMVLAATTLVPFHVPTALLAYEAGPLTLREVFGLGVLTLVLTLAVAAFAWAVYWPLVDGLLAGLV